ncbi:PhoH family protein [Candidatus Babeliales bacterium]|nr:PhoH family protein [Candidatus Babeliales bacterium]MCF7899441.1 PhoH family protein [Candidatus Babeliales bacterium]
MEQVVNKLESKKEFRANRIFVLDTNILLHDANALFSFKGVVIVIPFVVLQELDTFKRNLDDLGRNARLVIRKLDELRAKGCLSTGVKLDHNTNDAILKVIPTPTDFTKPEPYGDIVDDLILQTVKNLVKEKNKVTLVTKDINLRVKADTLGLDAQDYTKGTVALDDYYKGWFKVKVPADVLRKITANKLPELLTQEKFPIDNLYPNEFIILESENNPENNKLFRYVVGKAFKEVQDTKIVAHFGARNIQQLMALELLRDDSIKIISLVGPAGTGKTFLTLLMGMHKVAKEHIYKKFLITRPVIALGADIGYLPGEVEEKLRYWMQPVYDNLEFIFSQIGEPEEEEKQEKKFKKRKHHEKAKDYRKYTSTETAVENLIERGILSLEAITYMRGRSIPYQFVFIDEVQNLNPHEVKTIVSRAGEGTKIILAGDPFQIDSPYLDFSSNGLTITTEKFKKEAIFGTVFLEKSERSELAELAAKIL